MVYWKERRGAHLDKLNAVPLKVTYDERLDICIKKVKENRSVNYEKYNVSLVLSNVPAQKCFSRYFFRWFVADELQDIIPKETSNNAEDLIG